MTGELQAASRTYEIDQLLKLADYAVPSYVGALEVLDDSDLGGFIETYLRDSRRGSTWTEFTEARADQSREVR